MNSLFKLRDKDNIQELSNTTTISARNSPYWGYAVMFET